MELVLQKQTLRRLGGQQPESKKAFLGVVQRDQATQQWGSATRKELKQLYS